MTEENRSWLEVAGIWEDDTDEIEAYIEEGRRRSRERSEDRVNL
ncbi:MAG: hypothetical protein SXQ77_10755 [Halobacteria archaeon]|nr:hypothetical protein [Halobacteria archaeon]